MKTLTPAMKRALINALDSNKHMLFGVHPRTLGALDARDLITWWGALNMPTLNAAGIALAESLTGNVGPVSLVEQAEAAAAAHFANATSEDNSRCDDRLPTYRASEAALRAAIVAAYPACNVDRVYALWCENNESIAYNVEYAASEAAKRAADNIQAQLEDVAYLVGKDGSEADRAMFRSVHADNAGALDMLHAGEVDAAKDAERLAAIESRIRTDYAVAAQNAAGAMNNPAYRVTPTPADVTRMILAGDDAGLQAASDAVIAANTELETPKRQFCRTGMHSAVPAVTLTFDDGTRRLHWCAVHAQDAEAYRAGSDQVTPDQVAQRTADVRQAMTDYYAATAEPVPPLEIPTTTVTVTGVVSITMIPTPGGLIVAESAERFIIPGSYNDNHDYRVTDFTGSGWPCCGNTAIGEHLHMSPEPNIIDNYARSLATYHTVHIGQPIIIDGREHTVTVADRYDNPVLIPTYPTGN